MNPSSGPERPLSFFRYSTNGRARRYRKGRQLRFHRRPSAMLSWRDSSRSAQAEQGGSTRVESSGLLFLTVADREARSDRRACRDTDMVADSAQSIFSRRAAKARGAGGRFLVMDPPAVARKRQRPLVTHETVDSSAALGLTSRQPSLASEAVADPSLSLRRFECT